MELSIIVWFIILTIVLTLPVILIKKYIATKKIWYILFAFIAYIIIIIGYTNVLTKYSIYHMTPVWFISMVLAIFAGIFLFSEKIKIINIIGVVMGLVAMFLITR